MRQKLVLALFATLVVMLTPALVAGEDQATEREKALEKRVLQLESANEHKAGIGGIVFLYAVFCALWAQNTGRNAWLWFFLGLLFSVITVIVLLVKNADDRKRQRPAGTP